MLRVERSSEMELFTRLSNQVFGVRNFENTKVMRVFFFSKRSKFKLDFKKAATIRVKVFCY